MLDTKIRPFVREGGTAVVPVKVASDCLALKLDPRDVIPREKLEKCESIALPVCNQQKNHEYKVITFRHWVTNTLQERTRKLLRKSFKDFYLHIFLNSSSKHLNFEYYEDRYTITVSNPSGHFYGSATVGSLSGAWISGVTRTKTQIRETTGV